VQADLGLTAIFAVTATFAAVSFSNFAQWVGAITAMLLFAVGVFAFLLSYWNAVQRSRTDEIAVTELYMLMGAAIPKHIKRPMLLALVAQFMIAIVTTLFRLDGPNGTPGSSLAVGFLVPMLGFGLNGWWASFHGDFATRTDVRVSEKEIGQNADHG
jgi:hypothetical protein